MEKNEIEPIAAVKGGRCFNGAHRDRGQIVHAVIPLNNPNGHWFTSALCNSVPGRRSYGWSKTDKEVNCPKCIKKQNNNPKTP